MSIVKGSSCVKKIDGILCSICLPSLSCPVCQKVDAETAQASLCNSNGGYYISILFIFVLFRGYLRKLNDNDLTEK